MCKPLRVVIDGISIGDSCRQKSRLNSPADTHVRCTCAGDATCDAGLVVDTNDFGLSVCIDPSNPPPPCGGIGEECCTGVNVPIGGNSCNDGGFCVDANTFGGDGGIPFFCASCGLADQVCCFDTSARASTCGEGLACNDANARVFFPPKCLECGGVDEIPCGMPFLHVA